MCHRPNSNVHSRVQEMGILVGDFLEMHCSLYKKNENVKPEIRQYNKRCYKVEK